MKHQTPNNHVKELFPISEGIFHYMNYTFPEELTITKAELDVLFVTNYGFKTVSPLVNHIHNNIQGGQLTALELSVLAGITKKTLSYKWDKLAALLSLQYNPIKNYSDDYTESTTEEIDDTSTLTHNTTNTDNTSITIDKSEEDGGSEITVEETDDIITDGGTERRATSATKTITGTDSTLTSNTTTHNTTKTRTDNLTELTVITDDETDTRTDNLNQANAGAVTESIYGFNSSQNAVGANVNNSTSSIQNTGTETTVKDKDVRDTKTNTGTQADAMTGTVGDSGSSTLTKNDSESVNDTLTITGGLTKTTDGEKTTTVTGGLTHSTDEDRTIEGTKRLTGTETTVKGSEKTITREYTHLGNIGNLTTQQLINDEIELWRWNYIQQVLDDVKNFLTLPLYD